MQHTTSLLKIAIAVALFAAGPAPAAVNPDFSNPGVTMTGEALLASGSCIAKYAAMLDDRSKPAAEIGQRVARHCAREISRSAGLASWMAGQPGDFARNLRYTEDELTTNTVLRRRAAHQGG